MSAAGERRTSEQRIREILPVVVLFAFAAAVPFFFGQLAGFIDDATIALAYVVMALGLNIVVGFAGLLDLGYVAFFAIGAYTMGWLGSTHFANINNEEGIHVGAGGFASNLPGIHLNWLFIVLAAVVIAAILGAVIGLPTLRLRGDYIAIVTLAFGEIIRIVALQGDELPVVPLLTDAEDYPLTGGRKGITPVDAIDLPGFAPFDPATNLRPWYLTALVLVAIVLFVNVRLRDSRLGRAWIALREDEVAAASMGVPLVRTKLLAYGVGAAFGGISGAFIGSFYNTVNADQFEFSFSIFILSMVILGGLGSVWGVVVGALVLSFINTYLIPDVFNTWPSKLGLDFDLTELSFGIFGFLLVIMMVLRPQGLVPERRRKMELTEGVGTDESVYEARA
jgi:branched-chain amino acid transport system permease protein